MMAGELTVAGVGCKGGGLANVRAFFYAIFRGQPVPKDEALAFSGAERETLQGLAGAWGIEVEGLSVSQEQILLLILGCFNRREPGPFRLIVSYEGGEFLEGCLEPLFEELTARIAAL